MAEFTLNSFGGIAPRFGAEVKPGLAETALDVDLSSKALAPRKSDSAVTTLSGNYDSIIKWGGDWIGGNGACFLPWTIDGTDILIYLDNGTLKRKIGSTIVDLGQDVPEAPTAAYISGSGSLIGSFYYIYTFVRVVNSYQDESGPSSPSSVVVANSNNILVTRGATSDPDVKYWNLYRMSSSTTEYEFVVKISISETTYTDFTEDADLGIACPTWYTSSQGNEILMRKPPTDLAGIAPDLLAGMILVWKDSTLYFNEPGTPDFWPSIYSINFRTDIVQVVPLAGSIAVLCEDGPYRVDGTHPELFQQSKPLGREPCRAATSCQTNSGIHYLSDSGIVLFNLVNTTVISIDAFSEDWFSENIDYDTAVLAYCDDKLFLFHSAGALCFDSTIKQWFTLSTVVEAVWVSPETEYLYYLKSGVIFRMFTGAASSMTWKSGNLYGRSQKNINSWLKLFPVGSGDLTMTAFVDGVEVMSELADLDTDLERDQVFPLPEYSEGRAIQLQFQGTGTLKSVTVEYE